MRTRILAAIALAALTSLSFAGNPEKLPFYVYAPDAKQNHWVASGYMGEPLTLDEKNANKPHKGPTCIKVTFTATTKWGGVFWQDPPNDWTGEKPGGFNLTGAKKLSFWARGENGGEKLNLGIGGDKGTGKFGNTCKLDANFDLTSDWKEYHLDLSNLDLTLVKNGLFITIQATGKPVVLYLSEIRYE
jgi:hypothetical protein